jgi:peptide/nickel transport system permease protein
MAGYLGRRALWTVVTLFLFVTVMFFLVQIIIPHDFTVQFAMVMPQSEREALQEELGLNLPLWKQYILWIKSFFTGGFGQSFYGYPVAELIKSTVPVSLLVFLTGTAIAYLIGLWLGRVTGWRGGGPLTSAVTFGSLALYTSFPPWVAWLLTYFLARRFVLTRSWLRPDAFSGLDRTLWGDAPLSPSAVAGYMTLSLITAALLILLLNALLQRALRHKIPLLLGLPLIAVIAYASWEHFGFGALAIDMVKRSTLPIATYTVLSFGETMLIMRTVMADTKAEEYVRVARAKGLPERLVRDKHATRNALLPVVGRLIITLPYLLTGVVIIEDVLGWPGVGTALWSSLYQQDMPVVMVILMLVGLFSLIARLLVDIVVAALDPRIRISGTAADSADV